MKTQSCQISSNQSVHCDRTQKAAGRKIARLEQQLAKLDNYEEGIKCRMQDRRKFMSGKDAVQKNKELNQLCKSKEALRMEICKLQEMA